jgi:hypothetical protein
VGQWQSSPASQHTPTSIAERTGDSNEIEPLSGVAKVPLSTVN